MPQSFQCILCQHFEGLNTCEAFDEIPYEIISGQFDHVNPWPDADNPQDNGIRHEPLEDFEG